MALVLYEPPAYTPLTSPTRIFDLPHSGRITMTQHWQENNTRTGGAVWDAGQVLGYYIDAHHSRWANRSSLELGAGLGFASIVASRCGFTSVIGTDGDPNLRSFAQQNAADNAADGGSATAAVQMETLLWSDAAALEALLPAGVPAPDVIFASDVIYLGACRRRAWALPERPGDPVPLPTPLANADLRPECGGSRGPRSCAPLTSALVVPFVLRRVQAPRTLGIPF